jgi:hypothetical protein
MTTGAAFTPRRSPGRWCLLLFLCHTFHPFTHRPGLAGVNLFLSPLEAELHFSMQKNFVAQN